MKLKRYEVLVLIFVLAGCKPGSGNHCPFQFQEDENGVLLTEKGSRVFYYRENPKSLNGEYVCNHYIHPLYALNGDTLTEEFPPDYPSAFFPLFLKNEEDHRRIQKQKDLCFDK